MADTSKKPKGGSQIFITTLSMELISIPETEQCYIHENFTNALRRRIFRAVQDETATYKAKYYTSTGELIEEERPDEHVEASAPWKTWLEKQRSASKLQLIKLRRHYRITADQISKNPADFELLAKLRQADLEREARAKTAKKEAPVAPVKASTPQKRAQPSSPRRMRPASSPPVAETTVEAKSEELHLEPLAATSAD